MVLVVTGSMATAARDAAALEKPLLRAMFEALHQKARAEFWHHLTPKAWWKNPKRRRRDLLLLLGFLLLPLPHPVWLTATLEPDQRRIVASPFEGTLAKSLVRPGDKVESGQTLAQLDDREWTMRQTQAKAARDRALKLRDQAMTRQDDDPATSLALHLEAEEREMELRQVAFRLENLTLRSPVAGTVIEGDLDRMEGVPVRQGQTLFVIAPVHNMLVEMEIPQHRIAQVRKGQTVWVRVSAQPWHLRSLAIEHLLPEAQLRDTRSVFIAQTPLHLDPSRDEVLRPGMKGSTIVWCGVRPLGWILFQRPLLSLWNLGF
jgi:multidrug efflux pump subunit AcrA (membrane-fusion protein)